MAEQNAGSLNTACQDKKKRSTWEMIVVFILVISVVGVAYGFYNTYQKSESEKTLIYQLKQVRTALQIYLTVNKQKPASLKDLVASTSSGQTESPMKMSWEGFKMDADGNMLDPFGNPYAYDAGNLWVKCQTVGYEQW